MGSGNEPSNGVAFVPARSHSGTVTLTTPHGRRKQLTSLSTAQRDQASRAAARCRLKGKPARGSAFMSYTVDPLRLPSCTRRSRERSHVPDDHPHALQTRLAAARHAPEGPRAAPSYDGCAASLAASGWGEHARDVLSTPTARLEVGSSVRAVMTRERRWLVAGVEWPYGAHGESLHQACERDRRCSPRPPPGKPSTIRCSPDLVRSVGPSGAALGSR